jgi:hypothetical protein
MCSFISAFGDAVWAFTFWQRRFVCAVQTVGKGAASNTKPAHLLSSVWHLCNSLAWHGEAARRARASQMALSAHASAKRSMLRLFLIAGLAALLSGVVLRRPSGPVRNLRVRSLVLANLNLA